MSATAACIATPGSAVLGEEDVTMQCSAYSVCSVAQILIRPKASSAWFLSITIDSWHSEGSTIYMLSSYRSSVAGPSTVDCVELVSKAIQFAEERDGFLGPSTRYAPQAYRKKCVVCAW